MIKDRIDPNSPSELAEWSQVLGVSAYHLRKVIGRVGPVLTDIYHALGLRKWEIPKHPQEGSETLPPSQSVE